MKAKKPVEEKEYCVWNRITKDLQFVMSTSAQEACKKLGYLVGDCQVKEVVVLHRGHCVV